MILTKKKKRKLESLLVEFVSTYVVEMDSRLEKASKQLTPIELMCFDQEMRELIAKRTKIERNIDALGVF